MKEHDENQPHPDNSILVAIGQLRKGKAVQGLSEGLAEVIDAVQATGKSGRLTLHLDIKPASKGVNDEVIVMDDIVIKKPKIEKGGSFFYVDEGRLSKEEPGQSDMFRKTVVGEDGVADVEDSAKSDKPSPDQEAAAS